MNNKENPLKTRSKLATSASALILMVALAACSSGSQSSQQSSGSSPSSSSSSSSASSVEDYTLAFRQCLRDSGIDIPDPKPDQDDQIPADIDQAAFDKALQKCTDKLGPAPVTDADGSAGADLTEIGIKTAECLRKKGFDVPDPKAGEGIVFNNVPKEEVEKCLSTVEDIK